MTNKELKAARLGLGLTPAQMSLLMDMRRRHYYRLESDGLGGRQPTLQHAGRVEIIKFVAAHGLLDKLFITMEQKKR